MLTNNQLKPLFDLIEDLNSSAAADGCEPPYTVLDGSILEKVVAKAKDLSQATPAPQEVLAELKAQGMTFGECINAFAADDDNPFVRCAQEQANEGTLEVDSKTVVSDSENGAYVQAWVWVSFNQVMETYKSELEAAGYRIHEGTEDDGELNGRWWWTLSYPGAVDVITSSEEFDDEDAATVDAIMEMVKPKQEPQPQ
jgi:hypothetical protein